MKPSFDAVVNASYRTLLLAVIAKNGGTIRFDQDDIRIIKDGDFVLKNDYSETKNGFNAVLSIKIDQHKKERVMQKNEFNVMLLLDRIAHVEEHGWCPYGADLSKADLSGVHFSEADLSGANLSEVDFSGTNLSRANLRRANLQRANLGGANLSKAALGGANLSGAALGSANLSGTDLTGTNLSGANLSNTCLSKTLNKLAREFCKKSPAITSKHGHQGRIVYRTSDSLHVGNTKYTPGYTYIANAFSWDVATECHPGIYACATYDDVLSDVDMHSLKVVRCYVRDGDWTITAKGCIRCSRIRVLNMVK